MGRARRDRRGFDTDSLGTFTREVPREGSQLEAAREKARAGIDRSGLPFGLGSEGAFGPGPLGLSSVNLELVVLLDTRRGIEIVGRSRAFFAAPPVRRRPLVSDDRPEQHQLRKAGLARNHLGYALNGGGPRISMPRGFAFADAWMRARSTVAAVVASVAGSLAPR